jgi:hypothetical protein
MTAVMRRTALWTLLAGLGCQGHRSAAAEHALPTGMRTLQLALPVADTSCLEPGGTRVSIDLSDADVSEIEVLIRRLDQRPIIEVTRLSPERVRETGGEELEARTGADCGRPLSGGGSEFYFRRVDGAWLMTDRSDWQVGSNGRPPVVPAVRVRDGEPGSQEEFSDGQVR